MAIHFGIWVFNAEHLADRNTCNKMSIKSFNLTIWDNEGLESRIPEILCIHFSHSA